MQEKLASFSIKNWADDDKPREKLVQKGSFVLSDAELIAILFGSGSREESAVELSKRILASVDHNLNELGKLSVNQLMRFKGIGEAKAVTIAAALEVGGRRRLEDTSKITKIKSSHDVIELLYPLIGELPHEEFWIVYLNNSNKVVHKAQLSNGGITGTLVDVGLVLKQALELGAVGIILAHNHPSRTLKPIEADKQITQKSKVASEALDIKILDRLILAQHEYLSFADKGIL
tara:strand:+ start:8358 stop:9056 length:699 start_codon:yes stop_codon:yes gene_type:complete